MDDKKSATPGSQPDAAQKYVIELDEKDLQESISDHDRAEFEKHVVFMAENDLVRREVTVIIPSSQNKIVLSEMQVHFLIDLLNRQIREWPENQQSY